MRNQVLLLIASLLIMLPSQVTAQESPDETTIRKVVQYYFDGMKDGNPDSLKKAFHQQAISLLLGADDRLIEIRPEQLYAALRDNIRPSDPPIPLVTRIISMSVSEGAASVRVEFRYPRAYPGDQADQRKPPPGFERTEYLSLIRFKDGWRIVSRVTSVIRSHIAKVNCSPPSPQPNVVGRERRERLS